MRYRRISHIVDAVRMPQDGTVTLSGDRQVEVVEGDYLMMNLEGTFSGVIPRDYFEENYEEAPDEEIDEDDAIGEVDPTPAQAQGLPRWLTGGR